MNLVQNKKYALYIDNKFIEIVQYTTDNNYIYLKGSSDSYYKSHYSKVNRLGRRRNASIIYITMELKEPTLKDIIVTTL